MENVLVSLLLPLIPPPVLATLDRHGPSKAQDSSPASFYQPVRLLPGVLPEVQGCPGGLPTKCKPQLELRVLKTGMDSRV